MSNAKKSRVLKVMLATALSASVIMGAQSTTITSAASNSTKVYSYNDVLNTFSNTGPQGQVKQYIKFLGDLSYRPSVANKSTYMPAFTNANTFVNSQFDVKPSIFPSLRGVNTSLLDASRTHLWIGTNDGVKRINLKTNKTVSFTPENSNLSDEKVLLLIDNGDSGVYAITKNGVSHLLAPNGTKAVAGNKEAGDKQKSSGAKFKPVQLSAVRTKEISYYPTGDAAIPNHLVWVSTKNQLDFLPTEVTTDVTAAMKDEDNVYWIGTENGLQRVDFTEKDQRDIVQYMTGPRYLYQGDDKVLALATDGQGGVWVKNARGVTHIAMPKRTMKEKADFYEKRIKDVNDRRGMVAATPFTFSDTNSFVDYNSPTGTFKGTPSTDDNDGLWTSMYAMGEIFRYNTLKNEYGSKPTVQQKAEIEEARAAAVRATKAVLLLSYISGRDNGFPVRSYMLTSEAGAKTADGTDFSPQATNGFWFHSIIDGDGSTNPNGIIPSMKRTDGKKPIGYSIVRITGDSRTKTGSKLYTTTSFDDPLSYNGLSLSNEAIAELNKKRQADGLPLLGYDENDPNRIWTSFNTSGHNVKHVLPVITQQTNHADKGTPANPDQNNKPIFQLTVPVYAEIPTIFNDLFPESAIVNGKVDQNQIVYKADTSSDEVDGHYALFYTAYTLLCDDSTPELVEMKKMIADTTDKMTNLILKNNNFYIEDATGKSTQWSRWTAKYFNDQISVMEKQQPYWEHNVGVDSSPSHDDALSYGYEDGPLNALEVMATLKTAMTVTKDFYPMDQEKFKSAYDLTFSSSYDKAANSLTNEYTNGKGYINMALEYIKRREVRMATNAYNILDNIVASPETVEYQGNINDDANLNGALHNDWTQYINYSDEELGWFPVYELIMQEKDPVRYKQIVDSYAQWFENEKREENPFYTFLYQLAKPEDTTVDLQSAVRFLYRTQQTKISLPVQYDRQDVFYIEPGDRDKNNGAQTNYALPLDEQKMHRNNANPFSRDKNSAATYSNDYANYDYRSGHMDDGVTFTLPYWLGRNYGIIKEQPSHK